jgi:hypothetical protein
LSSSCHKAYGLFSCNRQANITPHSHRLLRYAEKLKFSASFGCWLVKTFCPQTWRKVVSTTCSKSANIKLQQVWFSQNLTKTTISIPLNETGKIQGRVGLSQPLPLPWYGYKVKSHCNYSYSWTLQKTSRKLSFYLPVSVACFCLPWAFPKRVSKTRQSS